MTVTVVARPYMARCWSGLYVGEVLSFPWRPQEAGAHVVPRDTGGR